MFSDPTMLSVVVNGNPVNMTVAERIRLRPGMYVGDRDVGGLHHVAFEVIHNAVAEVFAGRGSRVAVDILRSGGVRVRDDGGRIPIVAGDEHTPERFCTNTETGGSSYDWPAGGLHGIGLKAVTALSRRLVVEVRRDGFRRRQTFSRGEATSPLQMLGPAKGTGTTITLWPDPQIFSCLDFSFIQLRQRIEELAMLLPRLQVRLIDHHVDPPLVAVVHWPEGLRTGLERIELGRRPVHPTVIHGSSRDGDTSISIAFRWQDDDDPPRICSLCNGATTVTGTHVSGFYRGVTRAIHRAMPDVRRARGAPHRRRSSAGEDLRAGIVAIISVESPDPRYYSSTRDRVNNVEFDRLTAALTDRLLTAFLAAHPDEARAIAQHLQAPPTTIDPNTGM